ncbi:hypothetical protein [Sporosalibacterium faouarense]|uniref:hypothetical protein n=1 Tax=Sporosalibacterium faouarense TaxID=516123 RepID=UPI00192BBFB5|nr:hypothetical protein [Sporosalibacterium faouarense]
MNKNIIKNLMIMKLKAVDKVLNEITTISKTPVTKIYDDFVNTVNEATEGYFRGKDIKSKSDKKDGGITNIEIN